MRSDIITSTWGVISLPLLKVLLVLNSDLMFYHSYGFACWPLPGPLSSCLVIVYVVLFWVIVVVPVGVCHVLVAISVLDGQISNEAVFVYPDLGVLARNVASCLCPAVHFPLGAGSVFSLLICSYPVSCQGSYSSVHVCAWDNMLEKIPAIRTAKVVVM